MDFNLIYGRSGSGKSEYIYKDIIKKLNNNKIYLIVPEQSNLSAEKKLFDISKLNSFMNVEVLTLSRMAYRVQNEVGKNINMLSKAGKNMLIYDLIVKEKNNLNFLGRSEKNIDIVNRLFTEIKKHKIDINNLKSIDIEDRLLKYKVEDILKLYEGYEERIVNNYLDEDDSLNILSQNLCKSNMFDNSIIYIDDFLGFTPQEYTIFEELVKKAKEINVCITLDNLELRDKEIDIFYFNKVYANKLIEIVKKYNANISKICLDELYRFKTEEIKHLENNLYGERKKYNKENKSIKLYLAQNPYTEMEYVARTIHNLVKNSGYLYKDIGIISEDVDKYSEDARAICRTYNIPLFVDDKKDLNQNVLIRFIISLFDVYALNFSYESVIDYIKVGLLEIAEEDIFMFENYSRKWGIKYNKWQKEFTYEEYNDIQEKCEKIRKQVIDPLLSFKEKVSKNKTGLEISKELYNFLLENKISEKLDTDLKKIDDVEISNEYNTSFKVLVSVLEDIANIFQDERMSFEKYKELLQIGLDSNEIGKIPATQDQVILGDIDRTRSNKLKVEFVIGINDGSFPKVNKSEGFFNDIDREKLKEYGFELAKTSMDSLYEEQFNIYRTLTTPEEQLYLSYCSSDKSGASIRPSILLKIIKRVFPKLLEESEEIEKTYYLGNYKVSFEEALKIYRDYKEGKEIDNKWIDLMEYFYTVDKDNFIKSINGIKYKNLSDLLDEDNVKKLYGNVLYTSVSRLEAYRRCPFSFHLTYGLKLKEKEELKLELIDTGSFMHEVIDKFFYIVSEDGKNSFDYSDEEIKNIINNIINEMLESSRYYKFSSTAKFKLLTRRLKKVVYEAICYIVYTLKNSDYEILGHEIEFSNSSKYKMISIDLDEGKKVQITGKIDRADKVKIGENDYVRIIDYKSSIKDIDMNQVMAGLQIQLITYLDALCEQTSFEPSGILYMSLIDNVVKNSKNLSEEQIAEKIRNNFRMNGLVLADIEVIKAMDRKVQNSYSSDIIPVYITKDGEISKGKSNVLSKEEFMTLQKDIKNIIKEISKEILKGKIDIKPYLYKQKTGCDYCQYKPICAFNTSFKSNEYNEIKKIEG